MMKNVIIKHEFSEWSDQYVEKLTPMFPTLEFQAAYDMDEAMDFAPQANAIIGIGPQMPASLIAAMPKLEWIQSLTTGLDNFLHMDELPKQVTITRVTGVHGPQVSELSLMLMMALTRRLPAMLSAQKEARWERWAQPALPGKTLCILGLGSIAETLALYASTMGMTVTGVSDGRKSAPNVKRVFPRSELLSAAGEADFLVVLVPLTEQTRHIVNADVLAAMKPTGFLVNVARGGCVDESALIDALKSGQIAGAGLDVFATEPLPPDDPAWSAPNLIVTPHIAGMADIYGEQCLPIVIENLKLYANSGAQGLKTELRR